MKGRFGVAEQAISAIYTLSKHPDTLCSDILRRKTKHVFQQQSEPQDPEAMEGIEGEGTLPSPPPEEPHRKQKSSLALSQLLFIVGHIAIKQIVHLELCELEFKRRKAENEKNKRPNASPTKGAATDQDELDLIGGTTEDDFTEAMTHIRERELLYGANSLLSHYAPLVTEICSNNTQYNDQSLQAAATLCMAKLMCVSSEYCEKNLPLLITILEKSQNPVTRSNVVIALGDMAVCFNHLIDENTDFLYRRLNDKDSSVKRTCLMTLTFLILAGQVKVKGQLGEMAKCLEDPDKRIADLSRMFFSELATKDNAVYNQFIDMFSHLSAATDLEEASLKRIIKFLASFIEKVGFVTANELLRCLLIFSRINTRNSLPTSLPPDSPGVRAKGNGTMLPMPCRFFNTRTRRSRRRSAQASSWSRPRHKIQTSRTIPSDGRRHLQGIGRMRCYGFKLMVAALVGWFLRSVRYNRTPSAM